MGLIYSAIREIVGCMRLCSVDYIIFISGLANQVIQWVLPIYVHCNNDVWNYWVATISISVTDAVLPRGFWGPGAVRRNGALVWYHRLHNQYVSAIPGGISNAYIFLQHNTIYNNLWQRKSWWPNVGLANIQCKNLYEWSLIFYLRTIHKAIKLLDKNVVSVEAPACDCLSLVITRATLLVYWNSPLHSSR